MIIKDRRQHNLIGKISKLVIGPRRLVFYGGVMLLLLLFAISSLNPQVQVSPRSAFFTEPTEIELSSTSIIPFQLRYTTDGTEPNPNSELYQEPIRIEETVVIHAAAFRGGTAVSRTFTFPIFVGAEHQLPVISISTDPENLWNEQTGIYTNFDETGDDWERPAQLSFYEPDGQLGFQKEVGIRMHGGGTRSLPQKNFRIYAGYLDHSQQIKYPLFPELEYDTFNNFILRSGGGDWEAAFLRDAVMHDIAGKVSDIDYQAVRPAVLYLNGEYWGLYYLRERLDQHYLANKYGISKDRVSIAKIPHDVGEKRGQVVMDHGKKSAAEDYNRLFVQAQHCKECAHYNDFAPWFDIANFIDYMLLQLYSGNFDWPYGNAELWRYEQAVRADETEKSPIDGRFRWFLFDLDVGLGYTRNTVEEAIESAKSSAYGRYIDDKFPLRNVFYDAKFRQEYLSRAAELLNTDMSAEAIERMVNNRADSIRSEMPKQIERWKNEQTTSGTYFSQSMEEWEQNVDIVRAYVQHRTNSMFEGSVEFYELSGLSKIELKSEPANGGGVSMGEIHKSSQELPWTGIFFNEVYVAAEAHPNSGFEFDHWEGDIPAGKKNAERVVIRITDQEEITAVFRKKSWFEYIF